MGVEVNSSATRSFLASGNTMDAEHIKHPFVAMIDMDLRLGLLIFVREPIVKRHVDSYISS
ncbi:hypothetical protein AEQ67_18645 [Pseudomonas sp. RIT-PI-q]|nr:hypothetical protein AEQ67_18645 [Pseudomonas sp. RIT-PI-q]